MTTNDPTANPLEPDRTWQASMPHSVPAQIKLYTDHTLPQGSQQWLDWRASLGGTATQAPVISLNPTPYPNSPQTWSDLREGIGSQLDAVAQRAVAHGQQWEPTARELFSEQAFRTAGSANFQPVCVETTFNDDWTIGASLDGYFELGQTRHFLEIKCPYTGHRSETAKAIKNQTIPDHYIWQMAHQYLCLGVTNVTGWYAVYIPPGKDSEAFFQWLEVPPQAMLVHILRLHALWPMYISGIPQPGDLRQQLGSDLQIALDTYREAVAAEKAAKQAKDDAKQYLLDTATQRVTDLETAQDFQAAWIKRFYMDGLTLTKQITNSIDWRAYMKDNPDLDLTQYKSQRESWVARQTRD